MSDKEKAELKDNILDLVIKKFWDSEKIAEKLKKEEYVIIARIKEIYNDKLIHVEDAERIDQLNTLVVNKTQSGIAFIKNGGYKKQFEEDYKQKRLEKRNDIIKTYAGPFFAVISLL